jgi:excisionase family DNA binding protein
VPDRTAVFPHHGEAEFAPDQGRLLTRAEAADQIRMSARTVRRLAADGLIEEVRTGKRAVRVTEQSVRQYLAERRVHRGAQAVSAA